MTEYNYSGWRVCCRNNEAIRYLPPDNEMIKIKLFNTEDGKVPEGWWPKEPNNTKNVMITGICIWDARWQLEFNRVNKANQPARRTFSLNYERADAIKKIKLGRTIKKIYFPSMLGLYHNTLINWQLEKILQFKPRRILYHLPVDEYHDYICSLEKVLQIPLEWLHQELNIFAEALLDHIKNVFGKNIMRNIEFIQPYEKDIIDPLSSYIFPYKFPEKFGLSANEIFGVEEFAEIRLAYAAWKEKDSNTNPIPVLGGIIGSKSYYYGLKSFYGTKCIEI